MRQDNQMNAQLMTFQNSRYTNERVSKQTLIIDHVIGSGTTFDIPLYEPLRIDSLSEIYLDSFITNQSISTDDDGDGTVDSGHRGFNSCFVVKINEFDIKSVSNSNTVTAASNNSLSGSLLIPNEETSRAGITLHKNKKMNYVTTINPCKLTKITGSITNLKGDRMFTHANSRFILEFVIVSKN